MLADGGDFSPVEVLMTPEQLQALRQIAGVILDAVKVAGPLGAPGGVLYSALMAHGCTLHQFEQIMAGLVRAGMVCRDGELYFSPVEGSNAN